MDTRFKLNKNYNLDAFLKGKEHLYPSTWFTSDGVAVVGVVLPYKILTALLNEDGTIEIQPEIRWDHYKPIEEPDKQYHFNRDGTFIFAEDSKTNVVTIWDARVKTEGGPPIVQEIQIDRDLTFNGNINSVISSMLSQDGSIYVVCCAKPLGGGLSESVVKVYKNGSLLHTFTQFQDPGVHEDDTFNSVDISIDGSKLVIAYESTFHDAKFYNLQANPHRQFYFEGENEEDDEPESVDYIDIWDLNTGERLVKTSENANFAVFSPNGTEIVAATFDGIKLYDTQEVELLSSSSIGSLPRYIALNNEGNKLIVLINNFGAKRNEVNIYDVLPIPTLTIKSSLLKDVVDPVSTDVFKTDDIVYIVDAKDIVSIDPDKGYVINEEGLDQASIDKAIANIKSRMILKESLDFWKKSHEVHEDIGRFKNPFTNEGGKSIYGRGMYKLIIEEDESAASSAASSSEGGKRKTKRRSTTTMKMKKIKKMKKTKNKRVKVSKKKRMNP